jgi:hypothetical protein
MTIDQTVPAPAHEVPPVDRAQVLWKNLADGADEVEGTTLVGGKDNERTLESLAGVPFVVTSMTYNQGDINTGTKEKPFLRDFVSVEAHIHPAFANRFPRSAVVFNDGSTGIYRQSTQYLAAKGYLNVDESLPEGGEAHGSRYDVSYSQPNGDGKRTPLHFSVRLLCPEGLRKSGYPGPAGEATTWYFA